MIFNKVVERIASTAVIDGCQQSLSYSDLQDSALRFASYLKDVEPDTIFQIQIGRSLELVEAVVGILANGYCVSIIDPILSEERKQLISIEGAHTLDLDILAQIKHHPRASSLLETKPEALAYIVFTSGSTGVPKGVMIEHRNLQPMVKGFLRSTQLDAADRILQMNSISFDAFFEELLCPLAVGATLVIRNDECISSMAKFIEFCRQARITVLDLPTAFWSQLVSELPFGLWPELRACVIGGSALRVNDLQRWQQHTDLPLINTYGPSETTVVTTAITLDDARFVVDGCVPIGMPYPGTQLAIKDGELIIKGHQVGRGYLNAPEKTAKTFFVEDGVRCYRTGDLAFEREGRYYYRGRLDNQVKVSGHRVELNAVEHTLNSFEAIHASNVLVRDEQLIAYVVGTPPSVQAELIDGWMHTNDVTTDDQHSYDFQIRGWNSSKTGLPFSDAEMQDWLNQTMAKINSLNPVNVLEIGCGTGLIFFNLTGCQTYVGVDISESSIENIRANLDKSEASAQFHLMPAHKIEAIAGEFDTIIMNSVCQYFPDLDYFIQVVNLCLSKLSSGGHLFIGDIRDYRQQRKFYEWLGQDPDRMMGCEEELLIDPTVFSLGMGQGIAHVTITRKNSTHYFNEMTGFRYDAVITVSAQPATLNLPIDANAANNPGLTAARERASSTILAQMRRFQPSYMVPALIIWLDQFPLNANGKVEVKSLPVGRVRLKTKTTPPETKVQKELSALWEQLLNISGIGIDDHFSDLGGNSLQWIRAMGLIDQRIPGAAQLSFETPTIRAIATAIDSIQTEQRRNSYMEDVYLNPALDDSPMVFVTGATGFLGPYLVAELLERDDRPIVVCHSRSGSIAQMISLLEDIGRWSNEYVDCLHVVQGDLSLPRLGIEPLTYEMIRRSATEVFHCAAKVDLISSYEALKQINVLATRELIQIFRPGTQFNLISTLDIYSPNTGYSQAKLVAEKMLLQAVHLDSKVFRLGQLVTPEMKAKPNDILTLLIDAILKKRQIPETYCSLELDMVRVDQVAKAIVIHASDRTSASICDLGASRPVPITKVVGEDNVVVSYDEWIDAVSASESKLSFLTHVIKDPNVISNWLGWSSGSEQNWAVLKPQHTFKAQI